MRQEMEAINLFIPNKICAKYTVQASLLLKKKNDFLWAQLSVKFRWGNIFTLTASHAYRADKWRRGACSLTRRSSLEFRFGMLLNVCMSLVACCLSLLVLSVSVRPSTSSLWKYSYCCPEARCELLTKCAVQTRELIEVLRVRFWKLQYWNLV